MAHHLELDRRVYHDPDLAGSRISGGPQHGIANRKSEI